MRHPALLLVLLLAACNGSSDGDSVAGGGDTPPVDAPSCAPGGEPVVLGGHAAPADAKTYLALPFQVQPGTTRVEVGYRWSDSLPLPSTPVTQSVFDLGLWDSDGYRSAAGFRGWSGSRQGRLPDQAPVFVQADQAERGYLPGAIQPGVWYVDLGIAALAPAGADWTVEIRCLNPVTGSTPAADPVDATHVASAAPGWYHGDFHMHAFHSNASAPDNAAFVQQARDAQLDILMVSEYVTGRHWDELGATQRANPDLLIWPGREIITYFGHANSYGETRGVLEYRHGFENVSLADIQHGTRAAGALFQVNHPTTFPGPLFSNFCRGCAFELGGVIDWAAVDTIEVVNGPILTDLSDLGLADVPLPLPLRIQNPFTQPALDLWDDLLNQGYRITAVSGSDSKGVDAPEDRARKGYGSSATAVYSENLSRAAVTAALRAGHAYIRTRGVAASPALEFRIETDDGQSGIFGDGVTADSATLTTIVTGGAGQTLRYLRNGERVSDVGIGSDPFTHVFTATRAADDGPLGAVWRIEIRDSQSLTAIGNPVFLRGP